jgi:rubredoxin
MTDRLTARSCPVCNGRTWNVRLGRWVRHRETTNLVCQRCGWDYAKGEPTDEDSTDLRGLVQ